MSLSRRTAVQRFAVRIATVLLVPALTLAQQAGSSNSLDKELLEAARKGDTAAVQSLLQSGANIETTDQYGSTALIEAASGGYTDTVKLLLGRGANIEAKLSFGRTVLSAAAGSGHPDTVKLLLDKGANIHAEGDRALIDATTYGQTEMVKLLLKKGANIHAEGDDALTNAAGLGHTDIVSVLLDAGADIKAKDKYGNTALGEAALEGHTDTVKLLLDRGADIHAKGDDALIGAADGGHTETVKLLLDRGADIHAGGDGALYHAVSGGRTDTAIFLLGRGIDMHGTGAAEALIRAAQNGQTDMVKLLLDRGANIDAKDNHGYTAMIEAASTGHIDTLKFLLERGANIEVRSASGNTVLLAAASKGETGVVQLLLDKGGNTEVADAHGETALIWAAEEGNTDTVKLLLDKRANIEAKDSYGYTALIQAADKGKTETVKTLLDKGANIEAKENHGDSALTEAVEKGHTETVKALLERGAYSDMALIEAAGSDKVEIVRLLLDKGANANAKNQDAETPLIRASRNDRVETVKLLLDRGADPSAANKSGETALAAATPPSWDTSRKPDSQLLDLLRNARRTPRQEFEEEVAQLTRNPGDEALRERIIQSAAKMTPPPAIPAEARKALVEGATLIKSMRTVDDFLRTKDKFEAAIAGAPWWADAYYDYAVALEQEGWYADAAKQLKIYLLFDLPQDETQKVQDHITSLGTEQEVAKRNAEEEQRRERIKYVTGGAQRISSGEAPPEWKPQSGSNRLAVEGLYAYTFGSYYNYPNVFKMPNGHYIAATLVALPSTSGSYAGDEVFITDITHADDVRGQVLAFGTLNDQINISGVGYKVSISEKNRDGVITVVDQSSGAGFTLPIGNLYVARYMGALKGGFIPNFDLGYAPGSDTVYAIFFNHKLTPTSSGCFGKCAPDAGEDPLSLIPTYVVALDRKDEPISNSGYFVRWHGTTWDIEK